MQKNPALFKRPLFKTGLVRILLVTSAVLGVAIVALTLWRTSPNPPDAPAQPHAVMEPSAPTESATDTEQDTPTRYHSEQDNAAQENTPASTQADSTLKPPKPPAVSERDPAAPSDQAPLSLDLQALTLTPPATTSEVGPVKPPATAEPTPQPSVPDLPLGQTAPQQDKLLYGYGGKDEDQQHQLMLGVQKDDVTIKTDIKTGEEETDVQYIEIEIKLPK
jgi:cytoskeletal protein RodZ